MRRRTLLLCCIVLACLSALAVGVGLFSPPIVRESADTSTVQAKTSHSSDDLTASDQQESTEDEPSSRNSKTPDGTSSSEELTTALDDLLAETPGEYSITVQEIGGSQRSAEIDGNLPEEPASTIKVFIAWAVLKELDQGQVSYETITQNGSTVEDCLKNMIVESDNECAEELRWVVGDSYINDMWATAGFSETQVFFDENGEYSGKVTTTNDLTKLMVSLAEGTALGEESTDKLLDLMEQQIYRTRVAAGLPKGTKVASKPGWFEVEGGMTESETAIVWGPSSTYVLSVLGYENATEEGIAHISKLVYQHLQEAV